MPLLEGGHVYLATVILRARVVFDKNIDSNLSLAKEATLGGLPW